MPEHFKVASDPAAIHPAPPGDDGEWVSFAEAICKPGRFRRIGRLDTGPTTSKVTPCQPRGSISVPWYKSAWRGSRVRSLRHHGSLGAPVKIRQLEPKRPKGLHRYAWRDKLRERDRPKDILGKIRYVTGERAFLHDMYLHTGVEEFAGPLRCGSNACGVARPTRQYYYTRAPDRTGYAVRTKGILSLMQQAGMADDWKKLA